VDNIKLNLGETGYGGLDSVLLLQDRDKWRARECGNELSSSIKFWETIEWLHSGWPLE
jgi:hypothetical protein